MVLDNKVEGIRQDENDMFYTVSTNEKQKRQLYL